MQDLSFGRVAAMSFLSGVCLALGYMAALALRAVYVITKGKRWYQLRQL